jgi:hypothetical protein
MFGWCFAAFWSCGVLVAVMWLDLWLLELPHNSRSVSYRGEGEFNGLRAVPLATRKVAGSNANFRVRVSPFFPCVDLPAIQPNPASHFAFSPVVNTFTPPSSTPPPPVFRISSRKSETAAVNMSSPSKRSTRSSATPNRATRSSQQQSSPAAGPSNAAERTPRQTRSSQLASSPLFYQSSSPAPGANRASSPLRQMTDTQSTLNNNSNAPSSPLRQQTETQSAGDRTPRASRGLIGGETSFCAISLSLA